MTNYTRHVPRVALLFTTFAAGVLAIGCGPSPSDVCNKTFELVKADQGEAAAKEAIGGDIASCVEKETMRKDMQGIAKYGDNNKCLMSSKTFAEVAACRK